MKVNAVNTDLLISFVFNDWPLPSKLQLGADKELLLDNVEVCKKNEDYSKQKSLGASIHFQYSFKMTMLFFHNEQS